MNRKLILAVLWAVAILVLHAIPRSRLDRMPMRQLTQTEGPDKAAHVVLFLVLGVLWLWAVPRRPLAVGLSCLAYGAALEVMQGLCIRGRSGSVEDLLADAVGLAIGLAAVVVYRSRSPKLVPIPTERDR